MKNLTIIILTSIVILSCQKDVTIVPDTIFSGQIFIEGILFPGKLPQVHISESLPFFDKNVTPQEVFARGAMVIISSSSGVQTLSPDSTFDNFRCRWVPYYEGTDMAVYGETYELTVTYKGKTYNATTTIDQPKVEIEAIEYIAEFFDVYGGHDGVIVTMTDAPGEGNYYRFQMNRMIDNTVLHAHELDVISSAECTEDGELFLAVDLGRTIFNDENIDGHQFDMTVEVTFEYQEGDSAWVLIQSLDKNAGQFYDEMDKQLESIINPFVEPVFLDTKIEGAVGVFGSAVLSDSVLFIYPVTGD